MMFLMLSDDVFDDVLVMMFDDTVFCSDDLFNDDALFDVFLFLGL